MTMVFAYSNKALIIERQNGMKMTFLLKEKPELSFSNHVLHISVNGKNTEFEINNVNQFYFKEDDESAIEDVKANNIWISYQSDNIVVLEGVKKSDNIRIYSINGLQYPNCVTISENHAKVSLASLPKGAYLINIQNKQTFKVYKK